MQSLPINFNTYFNHHISQKNSILEQLEEENLLQLHIKKENQENCFLNETNFNQQNNYFSPQSSRENSPFSTASSTNTTTNPIEISRNSSQKSNFQQQQPFFSNSLPSAIPIQLQHHHHPNAHHQFSTSQSSVSHLVSYANSLNQSSSVTTPKNNNTINFPTSLPNASQFPSSLPTSSAFSSSLNNSLPQSNLSHSLTQSLSFENLSFENIDKFENLNISFNNNEGSLGDSAAEKRRKRRESHNAVERRRRDNINEKIQELSNLIPDDTIQNHNIPAYQSTSINAAQKNNKGFILKRTVDYVKQVNQGLQNISERNKELEAALIFVLTQTGVNIEEFQKRFKYGPFGTSVEQIFGGPLGKTEVSNSPFNLDLTE
ncbi:hypothetical protein HK099_006798 [Clydaea vesicula]|uniref:BHLH domain-containing protein n=1 Tax=Clydaea vesicula TaxID=447962 RepID=A0AAD5TY29_9FUNG|nr:hypothetical protein HK099_006798 [Clydaea vesicula]